MLDCWRLEDRSVQDIIRTYGTCVVPTFAALLAEHVQHWRLQVDQAILDTRGAAARTARDYTCGERLAPTPQVEIRTCARRPSAARPGLSTAHSSKCDHTTGYH